MKKLAYIISFITISVLSRAQIISSSSESNRLLTSYTSGAANDSIFVFCGSAGTLSASASGGTGPYTFTWYKYLPSTHQFSTTPYSTQTGAASNTISNLSSGGYKVVIQDASNTVVGCDIAWVWNQDLTVDAGNNQAGCSAFSLSGTVSTNGSSVFSYYNPPADQMIVGPSTNVTVTFTGQHTFVSDLSFILVGPPSCGSPSVTLSPHPGAIGQNNVCNSGNDFSNLSFTTAGASNLNVCTAPVPLTGMYSSYGASSTPIDWTPIYGCDASSGGWVVKVFDCVSSDVGILTNAIISFSGNGTCGPNNINYNSGAINVAIGDNTCSLSTAASYTVPLSADTMPITLNNSLAYNWTSIPPTTITNANTLNPTVNPNPTVDTWFYLNVSSTYGCNKVDSVFFDYTPAATATITAVNPLCSNGTPITLTVTPTSGTWSGQGVTDTINGVFDPAVAGVGMHSVSFTGSGCTGNASTTITVNQAASVNAVSNVTVCNAQMVNAITFTPSPSGASVSWTNNQTSIGLAASGNGNIPSFVGMNGTQTPVTATISAQATNAGCTAGQTFITITVNPLPIANAGADTSFCAGGNVGLNGSGGGTYSWLPANSLTNSTIANPLASPASTTVYTLTVTNSFGCSSSDTVRVTVHSLPVVSGGSNKIICFGSSVQLNASGAATYTWSPASSLSNNSIANPIASPTATTQYTVTGANAFGCSKQAVVTVVINPGPTVNAGADKAICFGSSTTLAGSGTANSYTWSPSAGLSSINSLTTQASPTASINYILTGAGSNGCTSKDTVRVVVNPLPLASAGKDTGFCPGSSVQLNAGGGINYSWTPAAGLSSTSVNNPTASPSFATLYTVTVTDMNGCVASDAIYVGIYTNPVIDSLVTTPTNCGNQTGMIQIAHVTGASPFLYSLNSGSTQSSSQFTGLAAGNYTVTVKDKNTCRASSPATVSSVNNVHASFTASSTSGSYPLEVNFTNTSSGANIFHWNLGNGTTSTSSDPNTTYTAVGVYTVTLIVYNNVPVCSDTASVIINVLDQPKIVIPNIVTPNGDGINEEFVLSGYGISSYEAVFYDRWGKKVGDVSGDSNTKWSPQDLHDGTYFYVITVSTIDGKTHEYKGHLTILR